MQRSSCRTCEWPFTLTFIHTLGAEAPGRGTQPGVEPSTVPLVDDPLYVLNRSRAVTDHGKAATQVNPGSRSSSSTVCSTLPKHTWTGPCCIFMFWRTSSGVETQPSWCTRATKMHFHVFCTSGPKQTHRNQFVLVALQVIDNQTWALNVNEQPPRASLSKDHYEKNLQRYISYCPASLCRLWPPPFLLITLLSYCIDYCFIIAEGQPADILSLFWKSHSFECFFVCLAGVSLGLKVDGGLNLFSRRPSLSLSPLLLTRRGTWVNSSWDLNVGWDKRKREGSAHTHVHSQRAYVIIVELYLLSVCEG